MDSSFWLWGIIYLLFILPLLTFIHEMGHGLMGLWFTEQPVVIQLGTLPAQFQFRWERVTFLIRMPNNHIGFARVGEHNLMSRKVQILICLGGPFASLIVLLGSVWQALAFGKSDLLWFQPFWNILAAGALLQLIFTLAPVEYPTWMGAYAGFKSDGYKVVKLLFHQ